MEGGGWTALAMIFIVFDVEIIFLFPFAIVFRALGGYGIAVMVIFTAAVFESFEPIRLPMAVWCCGCE